MEVASFIAGIKSSQKRNVICRLIFIVLSSVFAGYFSYLVFRYTAYFQLYWLIIAIVIVIVLVRIVACLKEWPNDIRLLTSLDRELQTKDRIISYCEISDSVDDRRALLLQKQINQNIDDARLNKLTKFRLLHNELIAILSFFLVGALLSYIYFTTFYGSYSNPLAQKIREFSEEHIQELPNEVSVELKKLAAILEQEGIDSKNTQMQIKTTSGLVKDLLKTQTANVANNQYESKENQFSEQVEPTPEKQDQQDRNSEEPQKKDQDNNSNGDPGGGDNQEQSEQGDSQSDGGNQGDQQEGNQQAGQKQAGEQQGGDNNSAGQNGTESDANDSDQSQAPGQKQQQGGSSAKDDNKDSEENSKDTDQAGDSGNKASQASESEQNDQSSESQQEATNNGDNKQSGSESNSTTEQENQTVGNTQASENNALKQAAKELDQLQEQIDQQSQGADSQNTTPADKKESKGGGSSEGESTDQEPEQTGKESNQTSGQGQPDQPSQNNNDNTTNQPPESNPEAGQGAGFAGATLDQPQINEEQIGNGKLAVEQAENFEDLTISEKTENYDPEYSGTAVDLAEGEGGQDYQTTLEEVERARPEIDRSRQRQEIPLEYKDVLR